MLVQIGVPAHCLFRMEDLLESRNTQKVVESVHALAKQCHRVEGYTGPCIGKPPPQPHCETKKAQGNNLENQGSQGGMFKFASFGA